MRGQARSSAAEPSAQSVISQPPASAAVTPGRDLKPSARRRPRGPGDVSVEGPTRDGLVSGLCSAVTRGAFTSLGSRASGSKRYSERPDRKDTAPDRRTAAHRDRRRHTQSRSCRRSCRAIGPRSLRSATRNHADVSSAGGIVRPSRSSCGQPRTDALSQPSTTTATPGGL